MTFIVGPVINKIVEASVDYTPVIATGLRYVKTSKRITKFSNPVRATTHTAASLLELFGGKYLKYITLCLVWSTSTLTGVLTANSKLLTLNIGCGNKILKDFYGE